MSYLRRAVDGELDELLPGLAAVAIEGPKGVGKSATARRRAATVFALDVPATLALVAGNPDIVASAKAPVLVDEWQLAPQVWNVVRRAVDADRTPGRFLLAGSATPPPGAAIHSGAGRILSLRMRPMCLAERGVVTPTVSLAALLDGTRPDIEGTSDLGLPDYVDEILASGLPGIRLDRGRARRAQLDSYLDRVVERDLPELGFQARRPETLRAWLRAYAAATATTTDYQRLLEAATPGMAEPPAKTTTMIYRDLLTRLWLLDPVPGWVPSRSPLTRLRQGPKHHLADPALAARLLGATAESLLGGQTGVEPDRPLLGALFESLAALTIRVAAQTAEARVFHLRTARGDHEVDFVVERADGAVVALEVKLASVADDVRHLNWLADRIGPRLLDRVVITTGPHAHRRTDGVAVIPLALLGP